MSWLHMVFDACLLLIVAVNTRLSWKENGDLATLRQRLERLEAATKRDEPPT